MPDNPFHYSIGTRVRNKPFVSMLLPQLGDKILDVGCGLGYFIEVMSQYGAKCTGIDVDDLCLAYCRDNISGAYFKVDLTKPPYPFSDSHFDKAICSEVLEHIKENDVILEELKRIMKPNGTLVVSTPCLDGVFGTLWKRIGHNSVNSNSHEYHHHKGYTEKTLSELLAKHSFVKQKTLYTMVFGVEAVMGISKVVVRKMQLKKIDSQANALNVDGMFLWKVYKRLFQFLFLYAKVEQPLAKVIKGHMIIMKGVLDK